MNRRGYSTAPTAGSLALFCEVHVPRSSHLFIFNLLHSSAAQKTMNRNHIWHSKHCVPQHVACTWVRGQGATPEIESAAHNLLNLQHMLYTCINKFSLTTNFVNLINWVINMQEIFINCQKFEHIMVCLPPPRPFSVIVLSYSEDLAIDWPHI